MLISAKTVAFLYALLTHLLVPAGCRWSWAHVWWKGGSGRVYGDAHACVTEPPLGWVAPNTEITDVKPTGKVHHDNWASNHFTSRHLTVIGASQVPWVDLEKSIECLKRSFLPLQPFLTGVCWLMSFHPSFLPYGRLVWHFSCLL